MRLKWLGAALAVMAAAALAPVSGATAKTTTDNFADAGVLAVPGEVMGNTAGNSVEPGEQQPCGMIGSTAWFRLDTTPGAAVTVDTYGSSFDTVLAVYQGTSLADLAVVDCNDDHNYDLASLTFTAGPAVYWVQAGGFGGKAGSLRLRTRHAPANDAVAGALDASNGFDAVVDTEGAGQDAEEPGGCAGDASLWYRVDVPVDTEVAIALDNGTFQWAIEAFQQRPDGSLEEMGCEWAYQESETPISLRLRSPAHPGSSLFIRVASYYSGYTARLRIMPLHLPQYHHPHDAAAEAKPIAALPFSDQTETLTASSVGEPDSCAFAGATVWYRFAPALPTPVVAHNVGSDFDTVIGVFRQDGDKLTQVACNDDGTPWGLAGTDSVVRFVADAGATYLFQVGGYEGDSGKLAFEVHGMAR